VNKPDIINETPIGTTDTPFLRFWEAINAQLAETGYPEMRFGVAHRAWAATVEDAQRESMRFAMSNAA
jgi:hypothetical protein